MSEHQRKGAPKLRRAGKKAEKTKRYYLHVYPVNKLRRILRCGTLGEARSWAERYGARAVLQKLLNMRGS